MPAAGRYCKALPAAKGQAGEWSTTKRGRTATAQRDDHSRVAKRLTGRNSLTSPESGWPAVRRVVDEADGFVKIIAISGAGQSGATLLAILLAQAEGAGSVGPLSHVWRAFGRDDACSCGTAMRSCENFGRIVPQVLAEAGNGTTVESANARARAFERDARMIGDWGDPDARAALRSDHSGYLGLLGTLVLRLRERAENATLIDSSGVPEVAFALELLPETDLRVINMLNDPRAEFAASRPGSARLRAVLRGAREWKRRQERLERWRHGLGPRYMALRTEDLLARPRDQIFHAMQYCGLRASPDLFVNSETVALSWEGVHLHAPADPELVARRPERITLRPETDKPALGGALLRAVALAATWPALRRHYPRVERQ